jgi:MFS family permease
MAIGISKPVGSELILIAGGTASFLVGIFAIFNAIGRPLFGALTDKITPKWAAVINLALILVVSVMMISARQGTIEVSATTLETKDGKNIVKEGTLITQDGKVELKKGMFVIKDGNIEKTNESLVLKEGSLSQKEDKTTIAPGIIVPVEKDGPVNLKKGALVLNKGSLSIVEGNYILYAIAFIGFWLCLGGWLAIAPAATATFFGMQSYARNYGVVFFAYGIGALLGGIISGFAKDIFGSYKFAFGPTAALAVLGIVLALIFIKPPKK